MNDEHLPIELGVFPTGPNLDLDALVTTVVEMGARRILELGVGDGSLIRQLAPYTHVYRALDDRPAMVASLRQQIRFRRDLLEVVSIVVQGPDQFFGLERDFFDVVLIHAPAYLSESGLEQGITGAQRALQGNGVLFLEQSEHGDDWVELCQGRLVTSAG